LSGNILFSIILLELSFISILAYAYARIKNKDGGEDIPFLLRNAQIKLAKVFEQLRLHSQYHYIRVILLKCRQWGGSTLTDIYMAWLHSLHSKLLQIGIYLLRFTNQLGTITRKIIK
jgi:hypothetical protein